MSDFKAFQLNEYEIFFWSNQHDPEFHELHIHVHIYFGKSVYWEKKFGKNIFLKNGLGRMYPNRNQFDGN